MELSLAADPGVALATAGFAAAPGSDPDDAATEAFAALLATLLAAHPNAPAPDTLALPTGEVAAAALGAGAGPAADGAVVPSDGDGVQGAVVAPAGSAVASPVVPITVALPGAAAAVAAPVVSADVDGEPVDAELVEPTALPTADAPDEALAFSSRSARESRAGGDQNVTAAAAAPTTTAPVAEPTPAFSSPAPPQRGGEGDQNVVATPVASTTPRAPASAAAEAVAPPTPPPAPVEQVVRAVAPLRQLGDGTHQIVLELRPAELGVVRVELSLDAGVVHLGLRADAQATGELLRAALPELRSQLDGAGLVAGRLAVDGNGTGSGAEGRQSWRTGADSEPGDGGRGSTPGDPDAATTDDVPTAYSTSAYGQIDVLL